MKRKWILPVLAVSAGILLLTGCTSSESTQGQNAAATVSQQGTVDNAGTYDAASTQQDASTGVVPTDNNTTVEQPSANENIVTDSSPADQNTQVSGEFDNGGQDAAEGSEELPGAATDDAAGDVSDADSSDVWSGTYYSGNETLSVVLLDASTISFAFTQSGITGNASVNGTQAVYNGDDHYVVVFDSGQDQISVSVANEEDYDASDSPLNGIYSRE